MKTLRVLSFIIYLIASTCQICFSVTFLVPSEQPTIQAGIDEASNHDTILVADGIYTGLGNVDIHFNGKNVVVISENGPDFTIIECGGTANERHIGFAIVYGEDSTSVISGFTIRGGVGPLYPILYGGGAIVTYLSSPKISNNKLIDNHILISGTISDVVSGGAIACIRGKPTIINNLISNNLTSGGQQPTGGGIFCGWCDAVIEDNVFLENTAGRLGGAIFLAVANAVIRNNLFQENFAGQMGGGIFSLRSASIIKDNIFLGNTANGLGGGLALFVDSSVVANNTFVSNTAAGGSGILLAGTEKALLNHNVISFGRILPEVELPTIGGAIYCNANSVPIVANSNIYGNEDGDWVGCIGSLNYANGNISSDPLFCDANAGNFYLSSSSPCVSAFNSSGQQIGALGIGCSTGPLLFSEFDTLYAVWSKSLVPQYTEFYLGDFIDGNSAADIVPSSILINNSTEPSTVAILESHPDFFATATVVSVSLENLVQSYGSLYNTTIQELSISGRFNNNEPFELVKELVYVGHSTRNLNRDKIIDIRDLVYLSYQAYRATSKFSINLDDLEDVKNYLFPQNQDKNLKVK